MKFHVSILQFDNFMELNKYTLNCLRYFVCLKILKKFMCKIQKNFCNG